MQIATLEKAEILVTAIVGMIGLRADDRRRYKAGKDIALANKETTGDSRTSDHAAGKGI